MEVTEGVMVAVMVMIGGGLCVDCYGSHNAGHSGDRNTSLSSGRHNVFRGGYFGGCCSSCQKQRWPADGFF